MNEFRLKLIKNNFKIRKTGVYEFTISKFGMPYPPSNTQTTDDYFYYGWDNYNDSSEIRRRTRLSGELKRGLVDKTLSYVDNWGNRENLYYGSL